MRTNLWLLIAACIALFAADALYHKHAYYPAEGWFASYAIYGFLTSLAVIGVARVVRGMLTRSEDYYGR